MGLGDAWEVADVWFEPHEGAGGLRVGVARRRGAAVPRPVCGAPRGARDSRERTWRHLGIWRHETIVRCAVPRAGCPGHGVRAARAPWEARPNSHLAAPFEARVVAAVASRPREADGRTWAVLRRAVAEVGQAADCSGAARVGADDASRARRHARIPVTADLGAGRVAAATDGRDRGAPARPCAQLEAHGGDAPAVSEVTRDMAAPCSPGRAGARPNASQAVDRLHVMRLAPREADRVRRAEAKSSAEGGAAARGDQVLPAEEAGEPGGAPGGQEGVAHVGAPAHRPRDGRGAPGGPPHARRGAGRPRARSVAGLGGALQRPADERGRGDRAGGARGNPQLALPQVDQRRHGGDEPGHPACLYSIRTERNSHRKLSTPRTEN